MRITRDWGNLVAAIGPVLDGERDPDEFCAALDWDDTRIIVVILQDLDHPDMLQELLDAHAEGETSPGGIEDTP